MGWPNNYVQGVYDETGKVVGIGDGAGGAISLSSTFSICGIPIIYAGGTAINLTAAGVLSGITALPTTYGWCWIWMPAAAVQSGVNGLYLANLTSTTGGTVYQNLYVSGDHTIPTALGVLVGTDTPVAQYATGRRMFIKQIKANSLGVNGGIRTTEKWAFGGTAGTKYLSLSFGSAYVEIQQSAATVGNAELIRSVINRGVANKQIVTRFNSNGVSSSLAASASYYASQDTTVDFDLTFTAQIANAADFIVLEAFIIETFF